MQPFAANFLPIVLPLISVMIALSSAVVAYRSSRTARRSFELASVTGQAAYEVAKTGHVPAVDLFLTEIEYRAPEKGIVSGRWLEDANDDELEVVVGGKLVNNSDSEILMTCRDHPSSGRTVWYRLRNQSVFIIDGAVIELSTTILLPRQTASFQWIDRRPKSDWIDIYKLHDYNNFGGPALEIPELSLREQALALLQGKSPYLARRDKVTRSGFRVICETRSSQRIATVWNAEIVRPPVEEGGRDKHDEIYFVDSLAVITGPLDDSIVRYRVDFDISLALAKLPKRTRRLPGRD